MVDDFEPLGFSGCVVMLLGCMLFSLLTYSFPQRECESMIVSAAVTSLMLLHRDKLPFSFVDYMTAFIPVSVSVVMMIRYPNYPVLMLVGFFVPFFVILYIRIRFFNEE